MWKSFVSFGESGLMRYLITVLILLTLDTISLSQAYAVPVEQDFDGMTFVKIDTQSFIFGSAPDQANYQLPEHPKVVLPALPRFLLKQ